MSDHLPTPITPPPLGGDPDTPDPAPPPWDATLTARALLEGTHKQIRIHFQRRCLSCGDMIPGFYFTCAACREAR